MKRFLVILGIAGLMFGVLMLVIGPGKKSTDETLTIVTTIGQITDVTRQIVGNKGKVIGLMQAGVDPHLYKASESDVQKLSSADIILYNGLNLEAKMADIFERMKSSKTVAAVGSAIPEGMLLESEDYAGHYDPHVWFDVQLWQQVVVKIASVLSEADPDHRNYYQERKQQYIGELEQLHRFVQQKAAELPADQRVLVTAHDAFRYFGKAYGFDVVGLQGISTESQAGTADVKRLADFIAERKIRAIFVESSVPERNIKAVVEAVRARNWKVKIGGELFSDAMGDEGTVEGTYVGMIRYNIDTIVDNLKE